MVLYKCTLLNSILVHFSILCQLQGSVLKNNANCLVVGKILYTYIYFFRIWYMIEVYTEETQFKNKIKERKRRTNDPSSGLKRGNLI